MSRKSALIMLIIVLVSGPACGTASFPTLGDLLGLGDSAGDLFVAQGTFEERPILFQSPCPVWVEDTGVVYHLFQTADISNADFDAITTPGVTSRLQLRVRKDLDVGCRIGTIVEVVAILGTS